MWLPLTAYAAPAAPTGQYGLKDPMAGKSIPEVIASVIRFGLGMVGALFLVYFLYGGFMWMTAGGDVKKVQKAGQTLTQAVIGLFVIMISYAAITAIFGIANQVLTGSK